MSFKSGSRSFVIRYHKSLPVLRPPTALRPDVMNCDEKWEGPPPCELRAAPSPSTRWRLSLRGSCRQGRPGNPPVPPGRR